MEREIDAFVHSSWLAGLRARFSSADVDQDGVVRVPDLVAALGALGLEVTADWAAVQIARFDRAGDGRLTFPDYAAGMVLARRAQEPAAAGLARAFAQVDTDGDERISVEELAEFYRWRGMVLSPAQVQDRIHPWDTDGDGRIDLAELVRMLVA